MADNCFDIRTSNKHGKGLFAIKDLKKGEAVYSYPKGKILDRNEAGKLSRREKVYLDRVGENEYEIIESPGRFVNHSCEPNTEEKNRTGIALKDIKTGDETTIDYDKSVYLDEPFKCLCGSKNCRRFIQGKE